MAGAFEVFDHDRQHCKDFSLVELGDGVLDIAQCVVKLWTPVLISGISWISIDRFGSGLNFIHRTAKRADRIS